LPGKFMTGLMRHKTTLLKNPAQIQCWSKLVYSLSRMQNTPYFRVTSNAGFFSNEDRPSVKICTILYESHKREWCLNSSIHEAVNEQHLSDLLGKYDNSDAAMCTFYAP